MNWRQSLLCLLVISLVVYFGCTKAGGNSQTKTDPLITEAKDYFEKSVITAPKLNVVLSKSETYLQSIGRTPLWNKAYVQAIPEGVGVVVPVSYTGGDIFMHSNKNGVMTYSLNSMTKLLMFKNGKGGFQTEIVTGYPDMPYLLGAAPFSGLVTTKNWQGQLLNEYKVTGNRIYELNKPELSDGPNNPGRTVRPQDVSVTTCTIFAGYNYAADDPDNNFSYSEESCTTTVIADGNAGFYTAGPNGPVSVLSGNGGTPSGGGTPLAPGLDNTTDSLTNPCFQSVFNMMTKDNNFTTEFTNILTNVFGSSDLVNYIIRDAPSTDPAFQNPLSSAETNFYYSGSYLTVTTTLNTTVMANASEEAIMETIFHELLHAELDANSKIRGNWLQHESMIESDIACELWALQNVFPGLSAQDGECIILGGFNSEATLGNFQYNTALRDYGLTADDVSSTNMAYQNGTKGTKCSQ